MDNSKLSRLRVVINENLRVQNDGKINTIPYIEIGSTLSDVSVRNNHVIFGRRGCGKTLLLRYSAQNLPENVHSVYINCENYKKLSFPNAIIEILLAVLAELKKYSRWWSCKDRKPLKIVKELETELENLKKTQDKLEQEIRDLQITEEQRQSSTNAGLSAPTSNLNTSGQFSGKKTKEIERSYKLSQDKTQELEKVFPSLKRKLKDYFELATNIKSVYLQIDDFYHLARDDQPYIIDYIHRLCKDLPLYFKVATIKHATVLYVFRDGQPIGTQERHDYQPINIDFTFSDLKSTIAKNKKIFYEFGRLAKITPQEMDGLFKGEGFDRLVIAGGGVPRDVLSLFLTIQSSDNSGDTRIGKDDVRILSRANFEARIDEIKKDTPSESEQEIVIKGIYIIRQFCVVEKRTNVLLVSEAVLQQNDGVKNLLNQLMDYRIIHSAGSALTHKSQPGTYHAFVIDMGCYAHMRVLKNKFNEVELTEIDSKEKIRSAPILDEKTFNDLWEKVPSNAEKELINQEERA